MSRLITIDTNPDFAPKSALPAPERLISGNPSFNRYCSDETILSHQLRIEARGLQAHVEQTSSWAGNVRRRRKQ